MGMFLDFSIASPENRYVLTENRLYLENYREIWKSKIKHVIGNLISHNFYSHDFFKIRPPYRLNRQFL